MKSENEMGLREIINMTRMIGIVILLLHFYYCCYEAFNLWQLTSKISDRVLENLIKTGLFQPFWKPKLIALGALFLTILGSEGRKNEKLHYRTALIYLIIGLLLYFLSVLVFFINMPTESTAVAYMAITSLGYLLVMTGGAILTRIVKLKLSGDAFNKENESFPQEENLIENEYSVNMPTRYYLKNKERQGWINIINGFRGLLLLGLPGSGKTLIVKEIIKQQIQKQYVMLIYDFKYPDLSLLTYNYYLKYGHTYKVKPCFYILNFDKPLHRSNPLIPDSMQDISDAAEAARTILLGLNHNWIEKQGDFWVESSVNFITAVIWYLKKIQHGKYCSLVHVIELVQTPYDKLFSILRMEPELEALIQPFVNAYLNDASQQLEGQIAGATISLSKLSSPNLYYVPSGNDFTMDIADPKAPKIVCIANNPQKGHIYGPVISLYLTALQRLTNKQGNQKSSIILEEFATLFF